jgi:hypothetical protein
MSRKLIRMMVASVALFTCPATVWAGTYLSEKMDPFHIAKANTTTAGRATGVVLLDSGGLGSGSVIEVGDADGVAGNQSRWFLTAAHVVVDEGGFFVGTGSSLDDIVGYRAESWYVPDTYTGNVIDNADVALVRVDRAFSPEIERLRIAQPGTIADGPVQMNGFGTTGVGNSIPSAAGTKKSGLNLYDGAYPFTDGIYSFDFDIDEGDENYSDSYEFYYEFINDSSDRLFARQTDKDFRIPYEFSSAPGDSGGAITIDDTIYGITSFGPPPVFTSVAGDVNMAEWRDWIYTTINSVENNDTPANAFVGSEGNPIPIQTSDSDDGDSDVFANNALNLQRYFQTGFNLSEPQNVEAIELQKAADLLGLTVTAVSQAGFAEAIGLDASSSMEQIAAEYKSQLEAKIDPSYELLFWQNGELNFDVSAIDSKWGFYRGTSQVATLKNEYESLIGMFGDDYDWTQFDVEDYFNFNQPLGAGLPTLSDLNNDGEINTDDFSIFIEEAFADFDEAVQAEAAAALAALLDAGPLTELDTADGFMQALSGFSTEQETQFFAVPEPTTGLLAVAGLAFASLRRRQASWR